MSLIRNDNYPTTGKILNVEVTATCLLPHDLVDKKHNNNPSCHRGAEISLIDSSHIKSGVGTTVVSLRYHKQNEYLKLAAKQNQELHGWRES